ncbi:MAG: HAD-IB family hydrolase [Deltaproteobacteria bacterium]|nr:HAD-IB family hydrolase [Deltaproteobacteria bacterium]
MKTIAFFDVDGTLMNGISGFYATRELVRRKVIRKRRLIQGLFYNLLAKVYTGNVRKMYETAIGDTAGYPLQKILEMGKEIFDRYLKARIYQEALDLIESHRAQGHRIVLISSGPMMIVHHVASFVKADHYYAVASPIQNGIIQKGLQEPFVFMTGKVTVAQQEARHFQTLLSHCYFYTDGRHDLELLYAIGHPHTVNPDYALLKHARKNQWPILHFKQEIG